MELGLTQVDLARLLGLGVNTISRWETGQVPQGRPLHLLLCLLRDVPEARRYLVNICGYGWPAE